MLNVNAKKILTVVLCAAVAVCFGVPYMGTAHGVTETVFHDRGSASANRTALKQLLGGDEEKVITIADDIKIDAFLKIGDNTTINAYGHTVTTTEKKGVILNYADALDYGALKNVAINGGTWRAASGYKKTMMRFAHADGITIKDATIYANYEGHGIELIACKNVLIDNCKLYAEGTCPSTCHEEQLQIDLAAPSTAPGFKSETGTKYWNGAPCKNITVTNCTVKGARAVCANFTKKPSESKYRTAKNYHSNITIKDCKLTGKNAEPLALFNTKSCTVTGNTIINNTKSRTSYSVGCHVAMMEGTGPAASKSNKVIISNNTIKGARNSIFVFSHNSKKFGTVRITGNNCYCKAGKASAIYAKKGVALSLTKSGNKTHTW
jgi:hypothetical protein